MGEQAKEEEVARIYNANQFALIKAISNIEVLKELPDTEEEIEKWEKKNPDRARQLSRAIDHIIKEFGWNNLIKPKSEE